jgi:hypothetical protein
MNLRAAIAGLVAMYCVGVVSAVAPNDAGKAIAAGSELAQQLRALRPETGFTNAGKLFIRASKKQRWETSYICRVVVTETNWTSYYAAVRGTNALPGFSVEHRAGQANVYRDDAGTILSGRQLEVAFAGSDFWLADLGLEFFHWPEQRVLKWEMKRSMGCKVLESRNPDPQGGYFRVLSWIHEETGGLVQAEALDARGKLVKEFRPTELEKVNGRHELKELEIENVKTGSVTRLVFDL